MKNSHDKTKKNKAMSKLHIIGGLFKGRKFFFCDGHVRPTSNYIRQVLFNWLQHNLTELTCLDAFSGSGALGLEALSRGARRVTFLEKDHFTYTNLKKNIASLNGLIEDRCVTYNTDTLSWLEQHSPQQFDIVFLDPPFHHSLIEPTCKLLFDRKWLHEGSLIYIEMEKDHNIEAKKWRSLNEKIKGNIKCQLFAVT